MAFFIQNLPTISHIISILQERMKVRSLWSLIKSMAESRIEPTLPVPKSNFLPEKSTHCYKLHLAKQISASTWTQAYSLPCLSEPAKKGHAKMEGEIYSHKRGIQTGKCSECEKELADTNSQLHPWLLSYGVEHHNFPFHKKHWHIYTGVQSCRQDCT